VVYKIINGKYDNNIVVNLELVKDSRTRGNLFKLIINVFIMTKGNIHFMLE
jgi:hypothetical protein